MLRADWPIRLPIGPKSRFGGPLRHAMIRLCASGASGSAGRAEPTDVRCFENFETYLLSARARTSGKHSERRSSMPTPHPSQTRRLPPQPSIEQLRKQAKELLEQYRASHPDAVAEVNRFEREPDPATFALSDAQRVLARAY